MVDVDLLPMLHVLNAAGAITRSSCRGDPIHRQPQGLGLGGGYIEFVDVRSACVARARWPALRTLHWIGPAVYWPGYRFDEITTEAPPCSSSAAARSTGSGRSTQT